MVSGKEIYKTYKGGMARWKELELNVIEINSLDPGNYFYIRWGVTGKT